MSPEGRAERSTFFKAFIPILITLLVLEGCFIIFFYSLSARNVKDMMGAKALAIGNIVALFLEEDIEGYKNFITTLDTSGDYYLRMNKSFERILNASGKRIAYIDTSIRYSENEIMYVLDGFRDENTAGFVSPGTVDSLSPAGKTAFDSQQPYLGSFGTNIDEKYGDLLSAYVPVRDKDGEFIGMVTVQATKSKYQTTLQSLYLFSIVSLAISAIVISLILGYSLGYIKHTFTIDNLTGLPNRSDLIKTLKRHQRHLQKNGFSAFVFMVDLDHFKKINDTYGHPFGDIVLRHVAQVLNSYLRRSDNLVRYGGEEFSGCVVDSTEEEAGEILRRMNRAVEESPILNEELGEYIHVTVSIGYAPLRPGLPPASSLAEADKALYAAKVTRNCVVSSSQNVDQSNPS